MSRALAALLLLAVAIPVAGQEILPPRAEPVQRGLLEDKLHEDVLHLHRHDGALGYEGRREAAQEEFEKWKILGSDPSAVTLDQNLTDFRGDPAPRFPLGKVTIDSKLRERAMRSVFPDFDPVWIAQERLAKLGYLDPDVDLDGKIGPRTRRALLKFQSEHGLSATGDLDPVTANELEAKTWIESRASFAVALPQAEEVNRPEAKRPPVERRPGETDAEYERRRQAMRDFAYHPSTPKKSTSLLEPGVRKGIPPGGVRLRNSELTRLNAEHPEAQWLMIECNPGRDRFTLWDEGGLLAAYENDPGDMVGHAIEKVGKARAGVVIGFKGFTEKEIHAFSVELNVKQELQDGSTAWRPVLNADGILLGLYQEPGTKIDGVILDQQLDGYWRARTRFSNANRSLWVQTTLSLSRYMKEYVASLLRLSSSGLEQSAQEMVEKSKQQLMRNHPELTEKQIYMSIREEIRQSHLGEVARRRQEAA